MATEWVCDVLRYCVGNACDTVTVELREVGSGETNYLGSRVMRVHLTRFVTRNVLRKQVEQQSRMG